MARPFTPPPSLNGPAIKSKTLFCGFPLLNLNFTVEYFIKLIGWLALCVLSMSIGCRELNASPVQFCNGDRMVENQVSSGFNFYIYTEQ